MIKESSSILAIESQSNQSFGTGCVVYCDEGGSYIVTAKHVIEEVGVPFINNQKAKIITKSRLIDLAVLYLENQYLTPLTLQITPCQSRELTVIGFSHFQENKIQKRTIPVQLEQNSIELQDQTTHRSYSLRKVIAKENFHFDRGNSGSPIFSQEGNIVGFIAYKEQHNIAYFVEVSSLKSVWEEAPSELFKSPTPAPKKNRFFYYLFIIPSFIFLLYFFMSSLLVGVLKIFQ